MRHLYLFIIYYFFFENPHEAPIQLFRNNKGLCGNATGLKACPSTISHNTLVKKWNKVMTLNFILLGIVLYLSLLESHYIFAQERGYTDIDTDMNTDTNTGMIR